MANNSFGNIFKITTFGESHGKAVGVVIDGCPSGLEIKTDEIDQALAKRAPGKTPYTSPRKEPDLCEIISGVFDNKTTGAPITILINNKDQDSSKYEAIKNDLRPGHANYTYLKKYGVFDYKGGGRASARETAARVAASVIADKILEKYNIQTIAYIKSIYNKSIKSNIYSNIINNYSQIKNNTYSSPVYTPCKIAEADIINTINNAKQQGDSLGGIIEFMVINPITGLGDPVYEKLEARLAFAMMSIPASKGFEIGSGFNATKMLGSSHNDRFEQDNQNNITTQTNNAGGILGGISNGMPIIGRVAFKPTSSINKPQNTVDLQGNRTEFKLPEGSRHDPCVAIRAVPVVDAMVKLVIADTILMNNNSSFYK